jgi:hypothetical protein
VGLGLLGVCRRGDHTGGKPGDGDEAKMMHGWLLLVMQCRQVQHRVEIRVKQKEPILPIARLTFG